MIAIAFIWLFVFSGMAFATRVIESEPNNDLSHPNAVVCGDTVVCGMLRPYYDLDYYRCFVNRGDSLVCTTFDCNGSRTNTFMALFDDQDSILATDNESGPNQFSCIRYGVTRSGYYTVRVMMMQNSVDSTYNLAVECRLLVPEDYDDCSTPRIISSLPYYDEGTTYGMTNQMGTPAPDVFYAFHNPVMGNIFIEVCTDIFDARVQLLGNCLNNYLDDANEGCGMGAILPVYYLSPGDYLLMVEGMSALQSGDFSISVSAEFPACPKPDSVVITAIGGLPFLDWPEVNGPMYYIIWQATNPDGPWEHLGTSFFTYYVDSLGFSASKRYYRVTSVCPW
jgi:hypothetical protein